MDAKQEAMGRILQRAASLRQEQQQQQQQQQQEMNNELLETHNSTSSGGHERTLLSSDPSAASLMMMAAAGGALSSSTNESSSRHHHSSSESMKHQHSATQLLVEAATARSNNIMMNSNSNDSNNNLASNESNTKEDTQRNKQDYDDTDEEEGEEANGQSNEIRYEGGITRPNKRQRRANSTDSTATNSSAQGEQNNMTTTAKTSAGATCNTAAGNASTTQSATFLAIEQILRSRGQQSEPELTQQQKNSLVDRLRLDTGSGGTSTGVTSNSLEETALKFYQQLNSLHSSSAAATMADSRSSGTSGTAAERGYPGPSSSSSTSVSNTLSLEQLLRSRDAAVFTTDHVGRASTNTNYNSTSTGGVSTSGTANSNNNQIADSLLAAAAARAGGTANTGGSLSLPTSSALSSAFSSADSNNNNSASNLLRLSSLQATSNGALEQLMILDELQRLNAANELRTRLLEERRLQLQNLLHERLTASSTTGGAAAAAANNAGLNTAAYDNLLQSLVTREALVASHSQAPSATSLAGLAAGNSHHQLFSGSGRDSLALSSTVSGGGGRTLSDLAAFQEAAERAVLPSPATSSAATRLGLTTSRTQQAAVAASPPATNMLVRTTTAAAASGAHTRVRTKRMALAEDFQYLSEYQNIVRQQFEFFEASIDHVQASAKGRKKTIRLGQVGIQCRHCAFLPIHQRERGAIYYPALLTGVYQSTQKMAAEHLMDACGHIPILIRHRLMTLRGRRDSTAKGGKQYWAESCQKLGLVEESWGLRFCN